MPLAILDTLQQWYPCVKSDSHTLNELSSRNLMANAPIKFGAGTRGSQSAVAIEGFNVLLSPRHESKDSTDSTAHSWQLRLQQILKISGSTSAIAGDFGQLRLHGPSGRVLQRHAFPSSTIPAYIPTHVHTCVY